MGFNNFDIDISKYTGGEGDEEDTSTEPEYMWLSLRGLKSVSELLIDCHLTRKAVANALRELRTLPTPEDDMWIVFGGKCRVCDYLSINVCDYNMENERSFSCECSRCHNMTLQPQELPSSDPADWWKGDSGG